MSKRCQVTGIGPLSGNNVSHSHRKTRRRFLPNINKASAFSPILGKKITLKVTAATLRSIDHNDGIDNYLLSTPSHKLTTEAQKLKRLIKKARNQK